MIPQLLLENNMKKLLVTKLKDGWILFLGNLEAIGELENHVYRPGTVLNELFEVCVGPGGGFALGKRTKELLKYLSTVEDLDRTIMLVFGSLAYASIDDNRQTQQNSYHVLQYFSKEKKATDIQIENLVQKLFSGGF